MWLSRRVPTLQEETSAPEAIPLLSSFAPLYLGLPMVLYVRNILVVLQAEEK